MIEEPQDNASKRHKELYNILINSPYFQHMIIKQEVSIRDLVPTYAAPRHKCDWYIKDLGVVIEVHGEQHYKPVNFGGVHPHIARDQFGGVKRRDNMKRTALKAEGYTYVEIKYDEKLSESMLIDKIEHAASADKDNTKCSTEVTQSLKEKTSLDVQQRRNVLRNRSRRK